MDENGVTGEVIWVSRCVDLKSGVWLRCTYRPEGIGDLKWPLQMLINLEQNKMKIFRNVTHKLFKIGFHSFSEHLILKIVTVGLKNITAIAGVL